MVLLSSALSGCFIKGGAQLLIHTHTHTHSHVEDLSSMLARADRFNRPSEVHPDWEKLAVKTSWLYILSQIFCWEKKKEKATSVSCQALLTRC